ncbi:Subtilisin-like protease SBT1.6 [Striga hermonthica]|uniref:Subtilisin-like protease SBT1.6 n=1 Tax=Striga hermonthica TaxID=68872 RepID=A0A9N7MM73_STRHE|nr:Subtilisin-like protease SBT1.6 [Striga hermonthica]
MQGYAAGVAKGVAPKARLAVYKVCWKKSGCFDSDILAAFDAAVRDGVDVISISIGGGEGISTPYYLDPIAIGAYGAVSRGIFVSSSAGNEGPNAMSVTNLAPWLTTVGAGTIDRDFPAEVVLNDGRRFSGVSLYAGEPLAGKMYPLVYPGKTGVLSASLCMENSLEPDAVRGKIVICDRGNSPRVAKGLVVKKAGGVGMILANGPSNGEGLVVYDLTEDDYVSFLCAIEYGPKTIQVITRARVSCPERKPIPENLNYPSIAAVFPTVSKGGVSSKTFFRVVKNVGEVNSVYRVKIQAPKGVRVSVKPWKLEFKEGVKSLGYYVTITVDGGKLVLDDSGAVFGSISWVDGKRVVRSPIVVTQLDPL